MVNISLYQLAMHCYLLPVCWRGWFQKLPTYTLQEKYVSELYNVSTIKIMLKNKGTFTRDVKCQTIIILILSEVWKFTWCDLVFLYFFPLCIFCMFWPFLHWVCSDLLTSGAWRIRESDHMRAPYTRISCWWVIMSAWPTHILFTKSPKVIIHLCCSIKHSCFLCLTNLFLNGNLTLFKTILILSSFFRIAWIFYRYQETSSELRQNFIMAEIQYDL